MKPWILLIAFSAVTVLFGSSPALALDPALDVSQYGHTAWTNRDGFSIGAIFAMAQTPDGYLWLGSEFGLFRFDGIRAMPWQPPDGKQLPDKPYALLVTRDGTLWIGTFAGLVSWSNGKLTQYPEIGRVFITSLFQDHEGTVWAGILGSASDSPGGRLCAIRNGHAECYGQDGVFGQFVWTLYEDNSGLLWVGAESGLWRWKSSPPKHYLLPGVRIDDLSKADDGRLLIAIREAGLTQIVGDRIQKYPIRGASNSNALFPDRDVDSNKLLRDRDGGLWIGTHVHGLIHVHQGRTDTFRTGDGLSGEIICSLFEDHEGNVWVGTTRGLDRFRELPITSVAAKRGLSDTNSLLAADDGSVWVATHDGLIRWKNDQITMFGERDGLPDDMVQSLFEDKRGRLVAFTARGLATFKNDRFVAVNAAVPSTEVYSISGDEAGDLWLSGNKGFSHVRDGHLVENFSWAALGRHQQAKIVIADGGGVWLGFWQDGGVLYFKDGQVRASYTVADGLGKGPVADLRLDRNGALWAATEGGGLSRIKDGHIATLTTKTGLSCGAVHWSIEDNDGFLWLNTACALVRISRSELDAWIADPSHRVETTLWDAADGVRVSGTAPGTFGPSVGKATDGKLWFHTADGIQTADPRHVAFNRIPPPIHILEIVADQKTYWQNFPGASASNLRLPPRIHDLEIDYTALSLVAPEKIHFKYKLDGQDRDWREVVNKREAQYTNLAPGNYKFRVIASNNSGVWNEEGDSLQFTIEPAYYQTNWFRVLCVAVFMLLVWAVYELRLRHLHHDFEMTLDARVDERTRIARELHDTLLQSFHGLLLRLQTVSQILRERPMEAQEQLDSTIEQAAQAITEGRDAVQGLRVSTLERNDLAQAIITLGEELATDSTESHPTLRVAVEGEPRDLHPILRDEIYKISAEALRNAFRHAQARRVEVEIRYDHEQFRLRMRDDGKGIDPAVLSGKGNEGHYGLYGMRERAALIGGELVVWSEVGTGTEVELRIPSNIAFTAGRKHRRLVRNSAETGKA